MSYREYPAHPLVGVGALIHSGKRILLIKRRFEPNRGRWSLPGGLLETGETLEEASRREVKEELGIGVSIERMYHVSDEIIKDQRGRPRFHYVLIDFLASPMAGEITLNGESEEYAWFDPEKVLELDVSENTRAIVTKYIEEHVESRH